jgi:hypothetical protein
MIVKNNFILGSQNNKFLQGEDFEELLFGCYISYKHNEQLKSKRWIYILNSKVGKELDCNKIGSILYEMFDNNLKVDSKLANNLKLFDILSPHCFNENTDAEYAVKMLSVFSDLTFIVRRIKYLSVKEMEIDFEVCHGNFEYECHEALMAQTI